MRAELNASVAVSVLGLTAPAHRWHSYAFSTYDHKRKLVVRPATFGGTRVWQLSVDGILRTEIAMAASATLMAGECLGWRPHARSWPKERCPGLVKY